MGHSIASASEFDEVLQRLGHLLGRLEELDEPSRGPVFEFLDVLEAIHRSALHRLTEALDEHAVQRARDADPVVSWLLGAYGIGIDERAEVEAALETIRPYISSHGGRLEVLDVADGVVRVRLSGSCSGCTASSVTLQKGVDKALRDGFPGFLVLEVEEDSAEPHPPPGTTLVQIEDRRSQ